MMQPVKSWFKEPVRIILDKVIQHDKLRNWAMQYADKLLYKNILDDNPGNISSPMRAREEEYLTLRNMLMSINRALDDGRIAGNARRTILDNFVGRVVIKDDAAIAAFEKQHGTLPPGFLLVSPTSGCNLHCYGCYADSKQTHDRLEFEVLDRILEEKAQLWGSYFTVVSGGEPLLYQSQGKTILDVFKKHSNQYFMMYTNGTLIDRATASALAEVGNVTPAISMEGFESATDARRGQGTYRKIMQAFENLRAVGVPFGVSLTATKENADIILNDDFVNFCLEEQGAVYMWIFQYMPIGRHYTLDLMVTPEQRLRMYQREQYFLRERKIFIADFWNSGAVSHGCISAGRFGGYFYINWKGDVMPCAFFPYTNANIKEIYAQGGDLNTALFSPFFQDIRNWQVNYGFANPGKTAGNWIKPCPMRDNHQSAMHIIREHGAQPADLPAREALQDDVYHQCMENYGREIEILSGDIWKKDYLGKAGEAVPTSGT